MKANRNNPVYFRKKQLSANAATLTEFTTRRNNKEKTVIGIPCFICENRTEREALPSGK